MKSTMIALVGSMLISAGPAPAPMTIEAWKHAAVFGDKEARLDGNAVVDHVDPTGKGNVRSNQDVRLHGNATVKGDVLAGDKIKKSGTNVTVTGDEKEDAGLLTYPTLKTFIELKKHANDNGKIGLTTLGTNPLSGADFRLQNQEELTLAGGEYFFTSFKLLGKSKLKVTGTATLFITGKVEISGKARLNPDGDPCQFRLLSNSDGAKDVKFGGQSLSKVLVYAMRTEVQVTVNAELFGAITAKSGKVSGNAQVHYHSCAKSVAIVVPTETSEASKRFSK